jgi:ABC-type glycerol-3-phosphate transport system permease component
MLALFLLQFTWIWNDLLFSTALGNTPEIRSPMNALQVFQGAYASGPNIALTGGQACVASRLRLSERIFVVSGVP